VKHFRCNTNKMQLHRLLIAAKCRKLQLVWDHTYCALRLQYVNKGGHRQYIHNDVTIWLIPSIHIWNYKSALSVSVHENEWTAVYTANLRIVLPKGTVLKLQPKRYPCGAVPHLNLIFSTLMSPLPIYPALVQFPSWNDTRIIHSCYVVAL
jgi:hypothetical protein